MKKLMNLGICCALLLFAACGNPNDRTSTTIEEDTMFNENNDMSTDTFIDTDKDPRRQGIEDGNTPDSLRVAPPPPVQNN